MFRTAHETTVPFRLVILPADAYRIHSFTTRFPLKPGNVQSVEQVIRTWNVTINRNRHEVVVDGELIELTATEFRLLLFLVGQPGSVFSRQQILEGINDGVFAVTDRAVDVHISGLRKKFGSAAKHLETVRGCGYRWRDPVDVAIEQENGDLDSPQSQVI